MARSFIKKKKGADLTVNRKASEEEQEKSSLYFHDNNIFELQKQLGNEATAELLEMQLESERSKKESGFEHVFLPDPVHSLSQMVREKYFSKGSDLKEYIPSLQEKIDGNIPKQVMNLEFNTGRLVGGLFEGNAKLVLVAMLKNVAGQTVNYMDEKKFNASAARSRRVSQAKVFTNDVANSAAALVIDAARGARRAVEAMQRAIENEDEGPTGVETFDRVLPFLNVRRDKQKLKQMENEMDHISRMEKELDGRSPSNADEAFMIDCRKKELAALKNRINAEINTLRAIIRDKLQKKLTFSKQLRNTWKNLKKSEDDLYDLRRNILGILFAVGAELLEETKEETKEKDKEAGGGEPDGTQDKGKEKAPENTGAKEQNA